MQLCGICGIRLWPEGWEGSGGVHGLRDDLPGLPVGENNFRLAEVVSSSTKAKWKYMQGTYILVVLAN